MVISGEAAMTNYSLEQAMLASSWDGSLVLVGSLLNRALFALMGGKGINNVRDLKGKRIGVSQIGDPPYNFAVAMIGKFGLGPRDVEWIPLGTDGNGRVAALVGGRVDATMVPPPAYFKLEPQGYKMLANLADYEELYAPMVYIFKPEARSRPIPSCPNSCSRRRRKPPSASTTTKRVRAIKSYMAYDPQNLGRRGTNLRSRSYGRNLTSGFLYVSCCRGRDVHRESSGGRADRGAVEGLRLPQGHR